ncbi:MAG: glycosyltransferase family 4 protein [Candidatus Heimdallarchaeota archaeon]
MNIIFVENMELYKRFTKVKTVGGIETNTNDVISELRKRGHNVWNFNREKAPHWVEDNIVDIIAASTFDPMTFLQVSRLKNTHKNNAAVVFHAHTTVEDLAGNFLPDKPIFNLIFKYWLKILYGLAHLLITPSNYSKKCLESIQKSMTYPIYEVSNGIRIEEFMRKEEYRENFRKFLNLKYNIPLESTVIINVGLSWKKKRVDIFGRVAKAFSDYYFIWVGPINKNPDIDEALKLDNVIFTGFYDDIREAYYGADLFLNTSSVENQGIPLIEAAICKLPIVASDLPAYDWVQHDVSCYKARSIDDFINGVRRVISDTDFKEKIIENAYKQAIDLHDFNKIGTKIEKLYRKAKLIKKIWENKRKN